VVDANATVRIACAVNTLEPVFDLAPVRAGAIREIAEELLARLTAVQ
jgi:hypothetical protein